MNNIFTIRPNFTTLEKYGFHFPDTISTIKFESEEFRSNSAAIKFKTAFAKIIDDNNLQDHYDNLLYIVLQRDQDAVVKYNYYINQSPQNAKELASLLLLFHKTPIEQPVNITLHSSKGRVELKSKDFSRWIYEVIKEKIENLDFPVGILGDNVLKMLVSEGDNFAPPIALNYEKIKSILNDKPKAHSIYKTQCFTDFIVHVWNYIENETHLKAKGKTEFPNDQLILLYDIAYILGWVRRQTKSNLKAKSINAIMRNRIKSLKAIKTS